MFIQFQPTSRVFAVQTIHTVKHVRSWLKLILSICDFFMIDDTCLSYIRKHNCGPNIRNNPCERHCLECYQFLGWWASFSPAISNEFEIRKKERIGNKCIHSSSVESVAHSSNAHSHMVTSTQASTIRNILWSNVQKRSSSLLCFCWNVSCSMPFVTKDRPATTREPIYLEINWFSKVLLVHMLHFHLNKLECSLNISAQRCI